MWQIDLLQLLQRTVLRTEVLCEMRGFDGCQVTVDERQSPDPPANAHAGNEGLACGAHMRVVCEAGAKTIERKLGR